MGFALGHPHMQIVGVFFLSMCSAADIHAAKCDKDYLYPVLASCGSIVVQVTADQSKGVHVNFCFYVSVLLA